MIAAMPIPTAAEAFELGVVLFVEATALVMVARALLRGCTRRSASLRATVATAAILGLLLLPLAERMAPSWLLPGSEHVPASWMEAPTLGLLTSKPQGGGIAQRQGAAAERPAAAADAAETWFAPPPDLARATGAPDPASPSGWPPTLLVGLWVFGVVVGALRILVEQLALRSAVRKASPPSARLLRVVARVTSSATGARPLRVRLVHDLTSPAVTGIWRPVLLLPPEAETWEEPHLEAVLTHEAGHLARGDVLDHHLGRWVAVLYWPNPLVRGLVDTARAERERACDDYALRRGIAPDLFATTLVTLAEHAQRGRPLSGAVAMAGRSPASLRQRVLAVLDGVKDRSPTSRTTRAVVMSLFLVITVPLAGARGVAEERVIPGPVVRGLAKTNPEARRIAVARLGDVCTPEVTRHALQLLSDPDPMVRVTAAGTIASYGEPPGVAGLLLAIEREPEEVTARRMVHAMATAYSAHAEAALLRLARHPRPELRALALDGLHKRPNLGSRTLDALADRLEIETRPHLRVAALRALGWRGMVQVPGVLHMAAKDESRLVRSAALEWARAHPGHPVAREALWCLAQDRDPGLRDGARSLLEERAGSGG